MAINLPQSAVIAVLRASAIPGIVWGDPDDPLSTVGNPYFQQIPEYPPVQPYVVIDFAESKTDYTFEDKYLEEYLFTVDVVATRDVIQTLGSPYLTGSVFQFLDNLMNDPTEFNGDDFACMLFARQSFKLDFDPTRDPDGGRVWIAKATYAMKIQATGVRP